jgi:hypothetical protein
MSLHASIMLNQATGRFHPILYCSAPRPSETPVVGQVCRHKSRGHHDEGFATLPAAVEFIDQGPELWPTGIIEEWDGVESPCNTQYLPHLKQIEGATFHLPETTP